MQKKSISQYVTMLIAGIAMGLVAAAATYRSDSVSSAKPAGEQQHPVSLETSISTKLDECDGTCCGNLSSKELMLRQLSGDKSK